MLVITGLIRAISLVIVSDFVLSQTATHADPSTGDRFFKYNDEQVTEVPSSEVLQDRTGSDANPALLCYVRKDKDLVETLHREVFERERLQAFQQEAEQRDIQIEDPMRQYESEELATMQQQAQPATLGDVEMGGQEVQASSPGLGSQLVDFEMTEPTTTSTAAPKSEKPLIDLGDDAPPPVQSDRVKEKEDDLMD